jgi:hypothetical protein
MVPPRCYCLALSTAFAAAGALGACGDSGAKPADAAVDVAPGACTDTTFAGEIIDWDATSAEFCGVFKARLSARGQTGRTDDTSPNGRFGLCIPQEPQSLVDVSFSTEASQCAKQVGSYTDRVVLVADQALIDAGVMFSARVMTPDRHAMMFTAIGAPSDPAKAQLVIHIAGTPHEVSLSAVSHDAAQQFNGTTWEPVAGSAAPGSDVLFPNVDPAASPVTVTVGGAVVATGIALEAGVFTYVTVLGN